MTLSGDASRRASSAPVTLTPRVPAGSSPAAPSTSTAVPSTSSFRYGVRGIPAAIETVMRFIAWRKKVPRITARVGGSRNSRPKMSDRNPGVSSSAPPKITSTPSATSRAGTRPAWIASLKRRHAARPCERMSSEPRMESAIRMAIVHQTPIAWPTWMITASSAMGTRMKSATSRKGIAYGAYAPAVKRS